MSEGWKKQVCDHCCSPDFCKNCIKYERFDWHSSANQDIARMTGCTIEDAMKFNSAPITDRFNELNHDDISRRECSAINSAYARSLEGEDTWFRMQRLIEEDNLGLADEYSLKLALKRSTSMVGYSVETIDLTPNTNSNLPTIDIHSLAYVPSEAAGRSGTKNHSRRLPCSAGFGLTRSVTVKKDEELSSIIERIGQVEFQELEEVFVKATNIGTNPYTHERVRLNSRKIDYNTIRVDGVIVEDALKPLREFYGQFNMNKQNFQGYVNKKSDGRSLTGYPDPKSGQFLQQNRHNVSIVISPNVKIQETTRTVKFTNKGGLQESKEIATVTRGEDCECGCNVKVKDSRRGEVVCPSCGLVFRRATIVG